MRNDARPIGEAAHEQSPVSESQSASANLESAVASLLAADGDPGSDEPSPPRVDDDRSSVTHGRQSHIVHPKAEERVRRDEAEGHDDPVMPTGDSSLRTQI